MVRVRRYNRGDKERLYKLFSCFESELYDDILTDRGISLQSSVSQMLDNKSLYTIGDNPEKIAVTYAPLSGTTYSVHIVIHPELRGKWGMEICIETADYMFRNTPCNAILAFARETKRESQIFAVMSGMKRIGQTKGTFLKDGEYLDEVIYQSSLKDFKEARKWQDQF